ncbi:MAG: heavy metal translocating P-type ATPase [Pirellulales bacterium]
MSSEFATDVSCDYCGLPVPGGSRLRRVAGAALSPEYCCSGCRFAASVMTTDASDAHVRRTLIKLGLGVFFAMNVMVFSMALWTTDVYGDQWGTSGPLAAAIHDLFRYLALIFCLPVLFLLGEPVAAGVWQAVRRRVVTTDLLLLVGVASAVAYSLWSVIANREHIYFDVASMILLFVTLGRWFEAQGKVRSNQALDAIAKLLPPQVHAVRDDRVVDEPRENVAVGDRLRVFPGERFGVDGVITQGQGDVDEQIVTGECGPVSRGPGDLVRSGTLNIDGDLQLEVTAAAGAETVSRMLDLVRKSRRARGQYQRLADRVTAWFVPVVAVVAIGAAWWHGQREGLDAGILAGLAVTLIACPCALGLATPMVMWVALGRAAKGHVLFRHGPSIERLAGAKAALFDKTGTITTGEAAVHAFVPDDPEDHNVALQMALQLAAVSSHSFSLAIQRFAANATLHGAIDDIETIPGKGISGRWHDDREMVDGSRHVLLGSPQWFAAEGFTVADHLWQAVQAAGGNDAPLSCIGWAGRARGVFVFREEVRPEAPAALAECNRLGLQVAVATGDRRPRAARLAEALGVPVIAEQLPEDKVAAIQTARERFGPVAMIGDGLNDAPALAASDIGIAMGCGADLSRESAAVCLLSNDLLRLPWTIELARQTIRIIQQNLCWSFSYNIIGIALAATGRLSPIFSAMSMVASSVFVITNSLRLNRFPEMAGEIAPANAANLAMDTASSSFAHVASQIPEPTEATPELQTTS